MSTHSLSKAVVIAAATVLAGAGLIGQTPQATAANIRMAQASPPAKGSTIATSPMRRGSAEFVEKRIEALHDQLKITPAEEQQWSAVATAMRDNAKSVAALIDHRKRIERHMSAVENLRSYAAVAKAHLDGIDRLIAAFEPLYAAMPEEQKKLADMVFARRPTRPKREGAH